MTKPYRFVLTLDAPTRRKLAELQVASINPSGRMRPAADIVRDLILQARMPEVDHVEVNERR